MDLNAITKDWLNALPHRKWNDTTPIYDQILFYGNGSQHESGWGCITIVGCTKGKPSEICCECADDLEWIMPPPITYGNHVQFGMMRVDCLLRSGVMRAHSDHCRFKVSEARSSVTIALIKKECADG